MEVHVEAKVLTIRDVHPSWGADRIRYQLQREGVEPLPGRTSIYPIRTQTVPFAFRWR